MTDEVLNRLLMTGLKENALESLEIQTHRRNRRRTYRGAVKG